jgi:hypothetical protein
MTKQLAIATAITLGGLAFSQIAPFLVVLLSLPTSAASAADAAENMSRLYNGGSASFWLGLAGLAVAGAGVLYGAVVLISNSSNRQPVGTA